MNWGLWGTMFARTKVIKSFAELFYFSALRKQMTDVSQARKEATEGTGRVALYSAFLLIAFLCADFVKEKRLKTFGIKGLLTLFLLR